MVDFGSKVLILQTIVKCIQVLSDKVCVTVLYTNRFAVVACYKITSQNWSQ